ncbi:hypothetical protein JL720_2699 [Aureococcus anophagefferens]|nr:hypothetical protein JL720_2699 [Aureococcus anophagefferens]
MAEKRSLGEFLSVQEMCAFPVAKQRLVVASTLAREFKHLKLAVPRDAFRTDGGGWAVDEFVFFYLSMGSILPPTQKRRTDVDDDWARACAALSTPAALRRTRWRGATTRRGARAALHGVRDWVAEADERNARREARAPRAGAEETPPETRERAAAPGDAGALEFSDGGGGDDVTRAAASGDATSSDGSDGDAARPIELLDDDAGDRGAAAVSDAALPLRLLRLTRKLVAAAQRRAQRLAAVEAAARARPSATSRPSSSAWTGGGGGRRRRRSWACAIWQPPTARAAVRRRTGRRRRRAPGGVGVVAGLAARVLLRPGRAARTRMDAERRAASSRRSSGVGAGGGVRGPRGGRRVVAAVAPRGGGRRVRVRVDYGSDALFGGHSTGRSGGSASETTDGGASGRDAGRRRAARGGLRAARELGDDGRVYSFGLRCLGRLVGAATYDGDGDGDGGAGEDAAARRAPDDDRPADDDGGRPADDDRPADEDGDERRVLDDLAPFAAKEVLAFGDGGRHAVVLGDVRGDPALVQLTQRAEYDTKEALVAALPSLKLALTNYSGAEYSYYDAAAPSGAAFACEAIWPASERQVQRKRPRALAGRGDFGDRAAWKGAPWTADLYLLAIAKDAAYASIRDLRGERGAGLVRAMRDALLAATRDYYGVPPSKLRVFFHYQPQFYRLHAHCTAAQHVTPGCECDRSPLDDRRENLDLAPDYYARATLTYKLRVGEKLHGILVEGEGS